MKNHSATFNQCRIKFCFIQMYVKHGPKLFFLRDKVAKSFGIYLKIIWAKMPLFVELQSVEEIPFLFFYFHGNLNIVSIDINITDVSITEKWELGWFAIAGLRSSSWEYYTFPWISELRRSLPASPGRADLIIRMD